MKRSVPWALMAYANDGEACPKAKTASVTKFGDGNYRG
jgi:hypothetical protein